MTDQNILDRTRDPEQYQWQHGTQIVKVGELSREDLLQAVCELIDVVEALDISAQAQTELIRAWRLNRSITGLVNALANEVSANGH